MSGIDWTAARDARLRRLRSEGCHWPEIGADLGVTPEVARERGRRSGAPFPGHNPPPPREDPARPPLPAGHPRAWGLLTAGTLLAGHGWPGWG